MGIEKVVELAADVAGSAPVRAMAGDLIADGEKTGACKAAQCFLEETWAGSRGLGKSIAAPTTLADATHGLSETMSTAADISFASPEQMTKLFQKTVGAPDSGMNDARTLFPDRAYPEDSPLSRVKEIQGIAPHNQKGFLEAGVYKADWNEFVLKLGFNSLRMDQIQKVAPLFQELKGMGLDDLYVGGSFVTKRAAPHDIDLVAALRLNQPTKLWQRISELATKGNTFGEHMMISHAGDGLEGGNLKVMRFNTRPGMPEEELGIVHLQLPTFKRALY